MTFIKADRVQEVSTTTGSGDIVLGGAYDSSYRTFSSVMTNGQTCQAMAVNENASNEWEVFEGTYNSADNSLTRSALISSSTGSSISYTSGSKRVAMLPPASKMLVEDNDGNSEVDADFDVGGTLSVGGTPLLALATVNLASDLDNLVLRPPMVFVQGIWTAGDNGWGYFKWYAGNSTPTQLGMCHSPATGTAGRYIRLFYGEADLQWIGAKGDGVQDDASYINTAIAWAHNNNITNNWKWGVPPVAYRCTAPIQFYPGSSYCGDSSYTAEFSFEDCHGFVPALPGTGNKNITLSGFRAVGNSSTTTTDFKVITGITRGTAKNVSAVTQANPGQVTTSTSHGLSTGNIVIFASVGGMTELNGVTFAVTVIDATNFTIGVDTTSYTAYTSGGTVTACGEVTTSTAHGFSDDDVIYINNVVGMTEVNRTQFTITVTSSLTFSLNVDTSGYTAYTSGGTAALPRIGVYLLSSTDVLVEKYNIEQFSSGIQIGFLDANASHRVHFGGDGKIDQTDYPNYNTGFPLYGISFTGSGGRGQGQAITMDSLYAQAQAKGNEVSFDGDGVTDTFDWAFSTTGTKNFGLYKETGLQVRVLAPTSDGGQVWLAQTIGVNYDLYGLDDADVATAIPAGTVGVSTYSNGSVGYLNYMCQKVRVVFRGGSIPASGTGNIQFHWADPTGIAGINVADGNGLLLNAQTIGGYDKSVYLDDGPSQIVVAHNINSRIFADLTDNASECIVYSVHYQYGTMQAGNVFSVNSSAQRTVTVPGINHAPVNAQISTAQPTQPFTSNNYTTVAWNSPGANLMTVPDRTTGLDVARGGLKVGLYTQTERRIELFFNYDLTLGEPDSSFWAVLDVSFDDWATRSTLWEQQYGGAPASSDGHVRQMVELDIRDTTTHARTGNRMWTASYRLSVKCDSATGLTNLSIGQARIKVSEVQPQ